MGADVSASSLIAPPREYFEMTDAEKRPFIMRHDCSKSCWNDVHRPRLELLKKCFGGLETKIKPQDIDGSVEKNGYFLFLEFKGNRNMFEAPEPWKKTAQDRYYENMTSQYRIVNRATMSLSSPTTTAVYVCGDAKTMQIDEIRIVYGGVHYDWEPCDLYGLQVLCWEWYEWTFRLVEEDRSRARADVAAVAGRNPWPTKRQIHLVE